jgi:hypothetical protein
VAKDAQGEPSGLSPLRSDGSHDGQAGGWIVLTVAKGTLWKSWKTTLETKGPNQKHAKCQPKKESTYSYSGDDEEGRCRRCCYDDEGQTNASQNRVTATLCIEDFFSGVTIYSSTPHIKVEVA